MPEQTLATRVPRLATAFTKFAVQVLRAAASMPSPPTMIKVVIAPGGPNFRASISAPDVLRTGPGLAAITRIGTSAFRQAVGDLEHRDRTRGIEQLEIRKDQHADHGFWLMS